MKIISSNIRFDNPQDGENAWGFRKNILTHILSQYSPDIICTQEGREPQLREFAECLNFELLDQARYWIDERMYPSIYIKKNMFQVINFKDIWLSATPHIAGSSSFESAFPRLACWVQLKHTKLNETFDLVNVHLDHLLESTRLQQIQVLIDELLKLNISTQKLIIAGDFNTNPGSDVHNMLCQQLSLCDDWRKFHVSDQGSHHKFNGDITKSSRIDWLLTGKNFAVNELFFDQSQMDGKWPSDHFPLKAQLQFLS
jgi:endonuclease/exonuclease/phosphatase family metal-dependent hydrolase